MPDPLPRPRACRSDSLRDYQSGSLPPEARHEKTKLMTVAQQEKNRQKHFINLIPSENFTSQAVLDALGSVMQSTCTAILLVPYVSLRL